MHAYVSLRLKIFKSLFIDVIENERWAWLPCEYILRHMISRIGR